MQAHDGEVASEEKNRVSEARRSRPEAQATEHGRGSELAEPFSHNEPLSWEYPCGTREEDVSSNHGTNPYLNFSGFFFFFNF